MESQTQALRTWMLQMLQTLPPGARLGAVPDSISCSAEAGFPGPLAPLQAGCLPAPAHIQAMHAATVPALPQEGGTASCNKVRSPR